MATKTKKRKTATSTDPFAAIIDAESAREYGPQFTQIRELDRQARDQYDSDIEAAKAAAASARSYSMAAIPKVAATYAAGRRTLDADQAQAQGLMQLTGPAADVFRNAQARETLAAQTRNTEGSTSAQTAFRDRASSAAAGEQFAKTKATTDYRKTRQTLTDRISDLLGQKGATEAGRAAELTASALEGSAKLEGEAAKQAAKDKAAREKHVEKVHTATGDIQRDVANAIRKWKTFEELDQPKDPKDASAGTRKLTVNEIRQQMDKAKIDPGIVHIALLRRVGKRLDAEAIAYLKSLKARGVRIPREWLRNVTDQAIHDGTVKGPPVPGRE